MSRYVLRASGEATATVGLDRAAAALVPEALRHVGKQVFESGDDERHHLYDAARAVESALAVPGPRVAAELTASEGAHVPEALLHVAREVFRDRREEGLLKAAAEAVAGAFPPPPGPRR